MIGWCGNCSELDSCELLCASVATYVNQDFVSRREELITGIENMNIDCYWLDINKSHRRLVYELYFLDGKDVQQILSCVKYEKTNIYDIIDRLKSNIKDYEGKKRDILELHFIEEVNNLADIAEILGANRTYTYSVVSDYLIANNIK